MKKTIIVSFCALFVGATLSCNAEVSTENIKAPLTEVVPTENKVENSVATEGKEKIVETTESIDVVDSKYNYDKDWEIFKEAVLNKDISGIGAFAGSDAVDAEEVLLYLSSDYALNVLKKTTYSDLKTVDENGEIYLEFSVIETGTDEDGNEIGSSVKLYFSQGDPSLVLEYYLVAG